MYALALFAAVLGSWLVLGAFLTRPRPVPTPPPAPPHAWLRDLYDDLR